jgi:hypothetical protein
MAAAAVAVAAATTGAAVTAAAVAAATAAATAARDGRMGGWMVDRAGEWSRSREMLGERRGSLGQGSLAAVARVPT